MGGGIRFASHNTVVFFFSEPTEKGTFSTGIFLLLFIVVVGATTATRASCERPAAKSNCAGGGEEKGNN